MRFSVTRLVTAWSITHFGYRAAVIALPLLALEETGSAWTVGLVAGAAGLPTITAPWWSRTLQQRLASARALSALLFFEGLATLTVPVAAVLGLLTPAVMIASGLAVGVLNAVSGPLDSALLATLGDERDPEHGAAQVLALQETSVRVVMTLAPLATLPLIVMIGAAATVALEGVLSMIGAGLVATLVVRAHGVEEDDIPRVHGLLSQHAEIRSGWTVRGVGCAAWFAFTLGLALLGQDTGRGALLATIGLTAYSVGAVVGSAGGLLAARSAHPAVLNSAGWLVAGLGWVVMGLHPTALVIGAVSTVMGLTVPAGNAATTAMVTRATSGLERRGALTAQATVVTGASTMGSLVGGPVIGLVGPQTAIAGAGVVVTVVSSAVLISSAGSSIRRARPRRSARPGDSGRKTWRLGARDLAVRGARPGESGSGGAGGDEVAEADQSSAGRDVGQPVQQGSRLVGALPHVGAGRVHRRVAAEQRQRLGVQALIDDRAGQQLEQSLVTRAGCLLGHQRRQRRHALAQVCAWRLAEVLAVGRHVDDVVGELEGRPDLLAELGEDVLGLRIGAGDACTEPCRRGDQRTGLVGHDREVVPQGVVAVARADGLTDLTLHQPGEGLRLDLDGRRSEVGHDLRGSGEQEVAGQDRHRVVPPRVGALGSASQVGLVHHVVVVERREVGQLHHERGGDDLRDLGVAELGREHHQERTEPLAPGVEQVTSSLVDEVDVRRDCLRELLLDVEQAGADPALELRVNHRHAPGSVRLGARRRRHRDQYPRDS
jgi:hypothetical protein